MKFMQFILVMTALIGASVVNAQWNINDAEPLTFGSTPLSKSIAVDLDGNVHTVFRAENVVDVQYHMHSADSRQWLPSELVTDFISAGPISDVAIAWNPDTQEPIVAFASGGRVWFATKDENNTWTRMMLGDPDISAVSPDIAVNSVGTVYVVYITAVAGHYQLEYGYYNGLTWDYNDIDTDIGEFGLGAAPRIAVDEEDAAHIVFRGGNFGGYNAKHATNNVGGSTDWVVTTLTVPHAESYPGDVAVDGIGRVHCMSSGSDGFGMPGPVYHHMRDETGDWLLAMPASPIDAVEPVLALDAGNNPHAFWSEISGNIVTGSLFYSTQNDNWQPRLLYDNSETGPAFVIDEEGYGRALIPSGDGSVYYLKSFTPLVDPGWGPEISIEPDTLAFGAVIIGEDSTAEVQLGNPNEAILRITGFDVVSPVFQGPAEWNTIELWWGDFTTVDIRFAPQAHQFYSAYAVITSNAITSPDTVYITGSGTIPDDAPEAPLPLEFELNPLYPNPFNGAVNVSYSLPRASEVSLRVYDVLGREVGVIANGNKQAGHHTAQWNCAECAAGIYLFKLEAAGQTFVQKAAFVK